MPRSKPKENGYCLEVLKLNTTPETHALYSHVGYMQVIFKTKESARAYHDHHNLHSRPINAHNTDTSDDNPETGLAYTIRDHNPKVELDYPPFDPKDNPVIEKFPNGSSITHKII
jgi:hypothetical protein